LASRRFSVDEVCRIFDFPSPLGSQLENATLSNVASLLKVFLNLCLGPWAKKLGSALSRALLPDPGLVVDD
jgi:hypothetical protein